MNAILQCLLPIDEFRDYYLSEGYKRFKKYKTVSDSDYYSRKLAVFMADAFSCDERERKVLNPIGLKSLVKQMFTPTL